MSAGMMKEKDVEYVEEAGSQNAEELEKEEKALVRKIDLYLLPTIWVMYLLSYMDVGSRHLSLGNGRLTDRSALTLAMQK